MTSRRLALRFPLLLLGAPIVLSTMGCPREDPGVRLLIEAHGRYMAARFRARQAVDFPTLEGMRTLRFTLEKSGGFRKKLGGELERGGPGPAPDRRWRAEPVPTDLFGALELLEDLVVTDPGLFRRNYRVRTLRLESFSGREARLVEVTHRRAGRPTYHAWIDVREGLLLGVKELGPTGGTQLFARYEEFVWNPAFPRGWEGRPIPGREGRPLEEVAREAGLPAIRLPEPYPEDLSPPRAGVVRGEAGRPAALLRMDDGLFLGGVNLVEKISVLSTGEGFSSRLEKRLKGVTDPAERRRIEEQLLKELRDRLLRGEILSDGPRAVVLDGYAGFQVAQLHTPAESYMAIGRVPHEDLIEILGRLRLP